MKKRISCLVFGLLCAALLIGCGKDDAFVAENEAETAVAGTAEPEKEAGEEAVLGDTSEEEAGEEAVLGDTSEEEAGEEAVLSDTSKEEEKALQTKKAEDVKAEPVEKKEEKEPIEGQEIMDEALKLNVIDFEGNEIPIKDLIKDKKVVMLNEWGTFCGPCISEMPDLGALERKYRDQGFTIIGLTTDVVDYNGNIQQSVIEDAKAIIADTEVSYPVVTMPLDMIYYLNTGYVPTTFFVDGDGRMLTDVMISSRSREEWEEIIVNLLKESGE